MGAAAPVVLVAGEGRESMRIVRVELKNIKSYREAAIDLQRGVTAIRGHNGAGKSTLLEAIGWALFDSLPYKQESFVREGESHGKVTVRFISPKDNREYEAVRRCGSGAIWYIVDPETSLRFDSSKDIHDFLHDQFRLDASVALKDLFTSAIGVPQGSLTADFLLTAAQRKKRFDALLQVEDYGAAVVKLNDTVNYLRRRHDVRGAEIQGLELVVAALEAARGQVEEARVSRRDLELRRDTLDEETRQVEIRRQVLRDARDDVTQREADATTAAARLDSTRQREKRATELLAESRTADEALKAARPGHERYLTAERARSGASDRQRARDDLRQRDADAASRQATAQSNQSNARGRLSEIERAERAIVALQDDLTQQGRLEHDRDEARQGVERLATIKRDIKAADARLDSLAVTIASRERETAQIEAERPVASERVERQRQVDTLRTAAATRAQYERRLGDIADERARNDARREQAVKEIKRHEANVAKLESVRDVVAKLPQLEEAEHAARQARDEASARLEQTRRSREMTTAGNCPFLAEPCLNIQKRGENNLRAWFDKRVAQEERDLAPLEDALKTATTTADAARLRKLHFERLDEYREQLDKARADRADCDATTKRLDSERDELTTALAQAGSPADLATATRLLGDSVEADRRLAGLATLTRELKEMRQRHSQETTTRDQLAAESSTLTAAPAALESASVALEALNDPRGRIAILRDRAAERATTEDALAAAEATLTALRVERAAITESLAPYAKLDDEITALERTITTTRADHASYMRNEQAASQLNARAAEREAAALDARAADQAHTAALTALDEARARFDPNALANADTRSEELAGERGQTHEAIRGLDERIASLEKTLAAGQEQTTALEAARTERDELATEETMLQQFRKVVGDAGPQVTRALLSQISQQANTIFGDIIGDRAGVLAWENDYEITLKRDGATRAFAQLSGGEQMSAALAVRLALLRKLTRLDMAFFDEPTQNMDGERRTALAGQLRRVRGFDQLIVISHDDTFEQGLDAVIHLEKRDGATCVASGEEVYASATPFARDARHLNDLDDMNDLNARDGASAIAL